LNPDFREMLSALSAAEAEYLVVGAYALAAHGYPRATGDLDIWINPTSVNAPRVWEAMRQFKAPMSQLSLADLSTPDQVIQIGVAPIRIDLLTSIDGVQFDDAWPNRLNIAIEGLTIAVIGRNDLLNNKRASGRPKDLADVAWLESAE
jgi:hypothetical protein